MQSDHRSTERVLDILELLAFRDASDGLTLTEISNSLQSPKSSISPILHTMAKKKYLSYKPGSSAYTLGIRTLEIGNAYMRKESFFERALTELQEVVDACNETCTWQNWMDAMCFTCLKWTRLNRYACIPHPGKCSLQMLRRLGKRSCPAIQGRN